MVEKREIDKAMQGIASRRPGKKRLVFDRATKTVVSVDSTGRKTTELRSLTEPTWI